MAKYLSYIIQRPLLGLLSHTKASFLKNESEMVQMLDSWSAEESSTSEHSIAKMMLMDVDKSPKAIEGCTQGQIYWLLFLILLLIVNLFSKLFSWR